MKKNADFRNALGQPDEYFRQSVIDTLNELNREAEKEKRPSARPVFRTVCACAAMLVVILGSVLAFRTNAWQALTASSPDSIRPTPEVFTRADPQVFETEDAVLTVREAVADKLGVYLTIDVKPKKENCLAVDMSVSPENNDLEAIGINPDFEGQTLRQWAEAHDYELLFINACLPSDVEIDHDNGIRIREDGSAVISICGKVLPDTKIYNVSWTAIPLDTSAAAGADLQSLPAERKTVPVRVSAERKTEKTVETDYVTMTFQDAKVRGTVMSVPIVIRPKNEKVLPLLLPANIDLSPEVIGKTPDYRNQTILQWATEHGYEEILSVWIGSPENAHPTSDALLDAYPDAFTLQEDGSLTGTVTGSAVRGADLYELSWDITPYDMERAGTISSASSADALDFVKEKCGSFRIHIAGKAEAPEIITAAQKPQVFETELATFTVREAVADDTGVYFTVDVKPKDERVLVVDSDEPVDNIGPERIGQKSDFEHQSVSQWVLAHDYKLLTVRFSLSPDGSDSSPHSFVLKCRDVNKEDSDIVYIIDKAKPDTQEYTLYCDAALKGPFDDSKPGILKLADEHNVFFPVRVSAKKETVKTVESDLVTMTFHDAVSDGTGVFIPAEIRAKNEKTLPLLWDTNFLGSPEILGKTPDYPDQTVLQWAREHGYEDLMFITLASPNMSPTSDARLNGLSNVFSLQDDGSLAGTIAGCTIPGADLYGLYWSVIPYDMDKAEKSMRENHGLTLESEKQESGIVQIAVTDEPKDPNEPIFIYVPLDDLRSTETSPTKTLVVLSHGSRCDYIRLTSTDPKFVNYNRIILRGDGIDNNAFYDLHIPYLTSTDKGKDGRYVMILSSCSFPDNPPKTLTMRLDQSDADSTLEPIEVTLRRQP